MDRLTTNKPAREMTMTELAHNGCYRGEDGWARYRDYDTDIDARDLARKLLARYEPEQPIPEETGDLDEFLYDELQYGALDHAGALVALMYAMIWSMADLRERLAAYEDTGLEPEEIKNLKNGIIPEHWAELFIAECEDRLVVPPCKVGDTAWFPVIDDENQADNEVEGCPVTEVGSRGFWTADTRGDTTSMNAFTPWEELGQRVFLTRQEAEAARKFYEWKKQEGDNEDG